MNWENLGLIFNKDDLSNIEDSLCFAKSPQALVKKDSVVVYFTSQKLDKNNKWVSLPYYVEYTKDFSSKIRFSKLPLIEKGKLGTFD